VHEFLVILSEWACPHIERASGCGRARAHFSRGTARIAVLLENALGELPRPLEDDDLDAPPFGK
jgi:hypothetical protein